MPGTDQWKEWLKEAVNAAWREDRQWNAVTRKNEIMKDAASSPTSITASGAALGAEASELRRRADEAEQHAPLLEVQPRMLHERTGSFPL